MAAVSSLVIGASIAVSAAGAGLQYAGSRKQTAAQEEALSYQQAIEEKRMRQMELDATRRKRELVRNQIAARSMALATTTAQGASDGSALPGAYGSISGRTGVNTLGVEQNLEIGRGIFNDNAGMLSAYRGAAQGASMSSLGSGLTSLGGAILNNIGVFNRVGTYTAKGGWGTSLGNTTFGGQGSAGYIY